MAEVEKSEKLSDVLTLPQLSIGERAVNVATSTKDWIVGESLSRANDTIDCSTECFSLCIDVEVCVSTILVLSLSAGILSSRVVGALCRRSLRRILA